MNEILDGVIGFVQGVDPVLRTIVAGVAIFLETSLLVGLLVPGDTVVIVASTAIASPVEYAWLVAVVIAGSLGGQSVGFAIGRWFGPRIRTSRLGRRIGGENWGRAERFVARRGGIAVFVSRFLPVFHALTPVTVGMSTMPFRRFMTWTVPACLVWAFAYASIGWAAAGTYEELSDRIHGAGYVFVGIIVAFLALAWLLKTLLGRLSARHMHDDADPGAQTPEGGPTR